MCTPDGQCPAHRRIDKGPLAHLHVLLHTSAGALLVSRPRGEAGAPGGEPAQPPTLAQLGGVGGGARANRSSQTPSFLKAQVGNEPRGTSSESLMGQVKVTFGWGPGPDEIRMLFGN